MLEVKPVSSRREKKFFRNLTDTLYADQPYYVPLLKVDMVANMKPSHPFYEHGEAQFFLAYKDGKPVGRICAYKNDRHNDYHKDRVGFFGSFECIDDETVCHALLDTAKQWLLQRGFTDMRGPVDYYSNEPQGLLIDGFDSIPPANLPFHMSYYTKMFENYGFKKQADLYAYEISDFADVPLDRGAKMLHRILTRTNITLRPLRMNKLEEETKIAVELFNIFEAANGQNFIPITVSEARIFIKTIKQIIDPELVYFAEHNGRPIGFVATIPDVNELLVEIKNGRLLPSGIFKLLRIKKRKYNRIRVLLLGMRDEYKKTGLGPAMAQKALSYAATKGFKSMDMSMIHEDNTLMKNMCDRLGGKIYKTYRVYNRGIA